jgi:hypothetical protein
MTTFAFIKAHAAYHRAAARCDATWAAYRKARERLARKRGVFAAEQGFIDASHAVKLAQDRLDVVHGLLAKEAWTEARIELDSERRARREPLAATLEVVDRRDSILAAAIASPPVPFAEAA